MQVRLTHTPGCSSITDKTKCKVKSDGQECPSHKNPSIQILLLTSHIGNRTVTYYASPIGYISGPSDPGGHLPSPRRSDPKGRSRSSPPGQSACGADRQRLPGLPSCHLEASPSPTPCSPSP